MENLILGSQGPGDGRQLPVTGESQNGKRWTFGRGTGTENRAPRKCSLSATKQSKFTSILWKLWEGNHRKSLVNKEIGNGNWTLPVQC